MELVEAGWTIAVLYTHIWRGVSYLIDAQVESLLILRKMIHCEDPTGALDTFSFTKSHDNFRTLHLACIYIYIILKLFLVSLWYSWPEIQEAQGVRTTLGYEVVGGAGVDFVFLLYQAIRQRERLD